MTRRVLTVLAWGVGGLVVALVLTLGAFAIAGQEISQPAGPPNLTPEPPSTPTTPGQREGEPGVSVRATPSISPTGGDDGSENSGSGSNEDNSGPGSGGGDDSSGSGDSGGGSDDSGSGSNDDSSGSGSGGDHDDD